MGSSCRVYLGMPVRDIPIQKTCKYVIIKKYDKYQRAAVQKVIAREIILLCSVQPHPHVLPLIGVVVDPVRTTLISHLITRFIPNTYYRALYPELTPEDVQRYTTQLIQAVDHLHRRGVVHCDIKPGNIVIDHKHKRLVLIDLGHARFYEPHKHFHTHIGTLSWRAPELFPSAKALERAAEKDKDFSNLVYAHKHFTGKIDMWSVGRVIFDMLIPCQMDFLQASDPYTQSKQNNRVGSQSLISFLIQNNATWRAEAKRTKQEAYTFGTCSGRKNKVAWQH
jgi:serine/threonine protein kinase